MLYKHDQLNTMRTKLLKLPSYLALRRAIISLSHCLSDLKLSAGCQLKTYNIHRENG